MKKVVELEDYTNMVITHKREKVLIYRWIVLLTVPILYILNSNKPSPKFFLVSIAIAAVYNILITYKSLKVKKLGRNTNYLILQLDVVIISVYAGLTGGINSQLYIVYFFMSAYCALFDSGRRTAVISVFSTILFSAASLLYARASGSVFSFGHLILKDIYIIFFAYGICLINKENKKMDEMHKKEFMAARTDKLTGLANRYYLSQKLKYETEQADISSGSLNVIMFDLDNFKQFNDSYGHLAGDELLVQFADIIKQNIRKTDIPVRYGGEEFLILIRDLDIKMTVVIAERICSQLEKQRIQAISGGIKTFVTASCGIAQYPFHSGNINNIIEYADEALYYAKNTGKNRVVTFDQIGTNVRNVLISR